MISTFRHGVCVYLTALALALFLVVSPPGAAADDFECGLKAYMAGDYESAIAEWLPLAEKGDAMAEFGLGVMYHKGEGVPQDQTEVIKWYRRAAEQGFAIAQYNLGFMYGKGRGVPQNYVLAHMWYLLATTAGYGPADTARYRLSQRLTAAERAAAQALARQCHNTGYRECGEATQAEDLASLFEGEDDGQP